MIDPDIPHVSDATGHAGRLASRLVALRPGGMLTVVGLDRTEFKAILSNDGSSPRVMRIELEGTTPAGAIARILDDLAAIASGCWPQWHDESDPPSRHPLASSWRRGAARFVAAGRSPRFRWLPREPEFGHLLSLHARLILLAEVDPVRPEPAAFAAATLEWCCHHGAAVVALLAQAPAPEPP